MPGHTEVEFEGALTKRGSDYTTIKYHHNIHKEAEVKLIKALETRGVETKVVQRGGYTSQHLEWADLVVTAGGDGTFLLGASKITNPNKPILGINTDPTRSEGYLCLPKHFSFNIDHAMDMLMSGKFRWFYRKRLRMSLTGDRDKIYEPAIELHKQQMQYPEYRYMDFLQEKSVKAHDHPLNTDPGQNKDMNKHEVETRTLPILALNEVFLGESLSSRVSYLEVKFDDDDEGFIKTRNSGLCISTGTGSTSWTFNINKLTSQSVEAILRIAFEATNSNINFKDHRLVDTVTRRFNDELVFDPELNLMVYTLRDPVTVGSSPGGSLVERKPRGKARKIEVKSRCFDACLVVDGSLSYKFNDGMKAVIQLVDDDALRCLQMYSETF